MNAQEKLLYIRGYADGLADALVDPQIAENIKRAASELALDRGASIKEVADSVYAASVKQRKVTWQLNT